MAAADEVDLELIGALMDGRLTGAERERAIKLLGNSEAAFEIYADAVRARADLDEAKVVPIAEARRPRVRSWRVASPFAVAALLMIAVLPAIRAGRDRGVLDASVASIASPILSGTSDLPGKLASNWAERDWPVLRGGGASFVDSTTSFRLGVRATDLRIALAQADATRAERIAGEIVDLLRPLNLADAVRVDYEALRSTLASGSVSPQITAKADRDEVDLAKILGSRWFDVGKWFAAGDIAARAHSASFFSDPKTARFLDWGIERGSLAPRDVELLRQVAAFREQGVTPENFEQVQRAFAELIRRYGG